MTTKQKPDIKNMTMAAFQKASGPGNSLEVLKGRQEVDAAWAERAFIGKEPLAPAIRIQRGRPKVGENPPATVVKAIRLPIQLLEKLQANAKAQGLSLNALLQMAASDYLTRY